MVELTKELEALIRRCLAQAIVGGNEENITRWATQLKILEDRKIQRELQRQWYEDLVGQVFPTSL